MNTPVYLVEETSTAPEAGSRDTIGGAPVLPAGESWPECFCGERMDLFFQLDIPADVPVFGGDRPRSPAPDNTCRVPARQHDCGRAGSRASKAVTTERTKIVTVRLSGDRPGAAEGNVGQWRAASSKGKDRCSARSQ